MSSAEASSGTPGSMYEYLVAVLQRKGAVGAVANLHQAWTGQVVTADIAYGTLVGLADVIRATSVAGAEADHHIAIADAAAAEAAALALAEPSAEHDFDALAAEQYAEWLRNLEVAFVAAATAAATAQATHANQKTAAAA